MIEDIGVTSAVLSIVSIAVTALIGYAVARYGKHLNVQDQEKFKKDIHDAFMTIARVIVSRGMVHVPSAITEMKNYVEASAPEAIAKLQPPESVLNKIAESKVAIAVREAKGIEQ